MSIVIGSFSSLPEADQDLLMAYLYNTLPDADRLSFEQRLETDADLASALKEEQALEQTLPIGLKPKLEESRAQLNQFALHKALRQSKRPTVNLSALVRRLFPEQGSRYFQMASMAITFLLGILFAQSNSVAEFFNDTQLDANVALVQTDEYEITDVQLSDVNSENGDVQLTYAWSSKNVMTGNLADAAIQKVIAASLMNNANDGARLNLVNIMQPFAETQTVQNALVYSLLNDPNPGVRLMAAESLVNYSEHKSTRSALIETLKEEANPGIRIQVYQALLNHLDDPETLDTIRMYSVQDSNRYIRDHANGLVKTLAEISDTQI
jgi:hypothetical protein